ncbi:MULTISPECIES: DNA repair protein RecO [unclassified Candidatus Frackibacter]|uniref:DNA repair protein RecO n=1 Tax=unclassified Candidatus Frackibacter TaxID=2648818 RepID=UPI00088A2874|nr:MULTISPECIES: DNA repair protein RecO [unclassified Candidatus Frackibacter]SDC74510.1 DNA replication and repair protein RecO [Candidatus Frackibacter sp. WG11]SEM88424.1 DNA replication and repair protein RecO [Candidatus Frackibacter sp. WG12]SFL97845.1 DNA replication and repair protein RecO [Candidatus Frackibacter sp. WG13]
MSLYKTDAIVLRHYEFDEADKLIVLYTRDYGKVKAVANGARKTKSRLAGGVELFTYNDLLLYQGKSLSTISQCEIKNSFAKLRSDLFKMAYASYLAEVVNEFTVEEEKNESVFALLLATLHLLNDGGDLEIITRFFELRLLNLLGYRPVIDICVECDKELAEVKQLRFSSVAGGLICPQCSKVDQYAMRLSKGTAAIMKRLLTIDYKKLDRLKVPNRSKKELAKILPNYLQSIIEKKLKSLDFIKTLTIVET